jgi:aminopeptidase N
MEERSGQDLGWFFDQWLKRAGSPVVDGSWQYNAAAKTIDISVAQTQPGEAYRLPLEIGVATTGANGMAQTRIEKLDMRQKQQRFSIASEAAPAGVTLDPNTWVLMQAAFVGR